MNIQSKITKAKSAVEGADKPAAGLRTKHPKNQTNMYVLDTEEDVE